MEWDDVRMLLVLFEVRNLHDAGKRLRVDRSTVSRRSCVSLRVRRVARLKLGLFAAPSYVERRGHPATPASLRGHDVILPAAELAQLPEALWLAARPDVRVVFRSNSMPALLSAAAAGLGIVPVAAGWGDTDRRLLRLQLIEDVPSRTIWLVTPPTAGTRTAIRVVADRSAGVLGSL